MSDAAPPRWVVRLAIPSGEWRCLVGLWAFAPYGSDGPAVVWPTRATLAEATGQTVAAVAAQLRKLCARGLVERLDGTRLRLAWAAPESPESPARLPASSPRLPASPATSVTGPTTPVTDPTTSVVGGRLPASPQNVTENFQPTSNDLAGDARGVCTCAVDDGSHWTPTPDCEAHGCQMCKRVDGSHSPSCWHTRPEPSPTPSPLPEHVQAVHDRARGVTPAPPAQAGARRRQAPSAHRASQGRRRCWRRLEHPARSRALRGARRRGCRGHRRDA